MTIAKKKLAISLNSKALTSEEMIPVSFVIREHLHIHDPTASTGGCGAQRYLIQKAGGAQPLVNIRLLIQLSEFITQGQDKAACGMGLIPTSMQIY